MPAMPSTADRAVQARLAPAQWIAPIEPPAPPGQRPAYLLRTTFTAEPDRPCWLYLTAHGLVEAFINGHRVGDHELTPGFTAYRQRLEVWRFDISDCLRPGPNTWVMLLSDGWFRGRHGFQRHADGFGTTTAVLGAIGDAAGRAIALTDLAWQWRPSHIRRADLMDGQATDFRAFDPGWFDGSDRDDWTPVGLADDALCQDRSRLVAPVGPPVRRIEEVKPIDLSRPRAGTVVIDLGQAINGWMRLTDLGPAGTHLRLTHGEVLDAAGLVTTDHLRAFDFATQERLPAGQIDDVVSAGRPGEVFEPRHTTHGFRFVQVDGVPVGLDLAGSRGIVVHTDLARTGEFACSSPELERLHEVARWSFRDNACALPTDCPQRERSGFTGDWQVFVHTATLMADVRGFARRWLRDLAADQWSDGRAPTIIPNPSGNQPSGDAFEDMSAGSAGWGDAAAIVPWELWRAYGDREALAEQFDAMARWVDYAAGCAASGRHPNRVARRPEPAAHDQYLWDTGFHFGEWLEPGVPPAPDPRVDHGIVATAYLHRSARIAAVAARILGLGVADHFQTIADGAAAAWCTEYLSADGRLADERQAHYVRGLAFGLIPDHLRRPAADHLAALIHQADDRIGTGFLATGWLLPALADNGHARLAGRLLNRTGQPSWLGMLRAGATTLWEYWDGIAPNGRVTGSLNHFNKGAVAAFLHSHLVGLRLPEFPDASAAGYRRVIVRPQPLAGVTSASTRQQTVVGPISLAWHLTGRSFWLDLDLPDQTVADIELPDGSRLEASGGHTHAGCTVEPAS